MHFLVALYAMNMYNAPFGELRGENTVDKRPYINGAWITWVVTPEQM